MSENSRDDVVITGIGIMSPIGIGVDAFWDSLSSGSHGFSKCDFQPFVGTPDCIGGQVPDFSEKTARKSHLSVVKKQVKVMCREIQLGVASALQAMQHAGIEKGSLPPERVGVDFGANLMSSPPDVLLDAGRSSSSDGDFDYEKWGLYGDDRFKGMEPLWLLKYLPNMPGCHIGIAVDARGPNNSLTQAEASGGLVLAEAASIIRQGRADVMIAGTTGTKLHPVKACQHDKWDTLAAGPVDSRCRPLDANRIGEVLSEASCTLILESRTHAEARGAKIYGSLLGVGASCVLGIDGVADEARAVTQAANMALKNAGVTATELGHVNSCASGHQDRDTFESVGIRNVLGDAASAVPVTATKSYFGSAGSGSGLQEIAASLIGFQHGVIPKTLNFESTDPETNLNVVAGEHLTTDNGLFLKTSVTRMGQGSAVVISGQAT